MKFMHISDLHIGRRINGFSMLENQEHMLRQVIDISKENNISGILISGDVYDRTIPAIEAVELFDNFLTEMSVNDISVFIISGNHDSPERLGFGSRIMSKHNVHIAGCFNGTIPKIPIADDEVEINIYLMPFLKPSIVNSCLHTVTQNYQESIETALETVDIDTDKCNILLAHQFVTNGGILPEVSESEIKTLGGLDNVASEIFKDFNYVALGHIHKPQNIGSNKIRYSGSPLKYSFSECNHTKSVTILNCKPSKEIEIETIPLIPLYDMFEITCSLEKLESLSLYKEYPQDSYMHIILTNDNEIIDAIGKVRAIYPNTMRLEFLNTPTNNVMSNRLSDTDLMQKSPMELFENFFKLQNEKAMTETQKSILNEIINEVTSK